MSDDYIPAIFSGRTTRQLLYRFLFAGETTSQERRRKSSRDWG
jgi:hypothetical protein